MIFIIDRLFLRTGTISLFINCLASYLLIAAVRRGAWSVFLNSKWLRALGRISFSLYLFHPLILYFISQYSDYFGTEGVLPHIAVIAIAIPLSVMIAHVAFYLVEKQSITLGKTFSL